MNPKRNTQPTTVSPSRQSFWRVAMAGMTSKRFVTNLKASGVLTASQIFQAGAGRSIVRSTITSSSF